MSNPAFFSSAWLLSSCRLEGALRSQWCPIVGALAWRFLFQAVLLLFPVYHFPHFLNWYTDVDPSVKHSEIFGRKALCKLDIIYHSGRCYVPFKSRGVTGTLELWARVCLLHIITISH